MDDDWMDGVVAFVFLFGIVLTLVGLLIETST